MYSKKGKVIMMTKRKQPEWLDNAVFYEIYPQSFRDTNADGIGDINGIIEKLDYIQDLGCNAIWINPCFQSPFGDAGYDVEDYYTVAPRYGTNEDLIRLFEEAHRKDMHILLDLVPGHTAVTHEWFKQSMKAERNEYTDRYCNLLEYLTQRDIQTKNSGVNVRYRGKHRFFKGFNEFIKEKTRRCDNDFEKIERHVFF